MSKHDGPTFDRRRARIVAQAGVLLALLAIAACGSKREPVTHHVAIKGMQYVPATLEVHVGDTVVWTNEDVLPHTVTSGIPSAATFDSRSIDAKREWSYEVTTEGETAYVCTYHPTMHGTLIAR